MEEGLQASHLLRFGPFEADLEAGQLRKNGVRVKLPQQPFQVLVCLLERSGRVVTREALIAQLWPNGTVVEYEHSLATAINKIRQVLSDSADNPQFVETLPRRGYRFLVPVERIGRPPEERPPQVATLAPEFGTTISYYKITEKLGEGGMGVVYRAQDNKLKRDVALKFLPLHALDDAELKARFLQEAQAAAALNHPNICTVYEIDEQDGQPFIAMEWIAGKNLKELVRSGPRDLEEALDFATQMAKALQAAHEKDIVHRDVKSANVMVTTEGQVKVMDFGLALLGGSRGLTKSGTTLGTPAYMSPEQTLGQKVDHRSDIWSLGVVLYEMVSGQLPFKGELEAALAYSIVNEEPAPLTGLRTGVPLALDRIVGKTLEKDPDDRYQHADEILVDLRAVQRATASGTSRIVTTKKRVRSRPLRQWGPRVVGLVAAGIAVIAGVTWWLNRSPEPTTESPAQYRLSQITRDSGYTAEPALSPDGKLLAYASDRSGEDNIDIWVQQVAGGQPIRLTTHEANERYPSFSPDGNRIVFRSERNGRGIYVIPALGGNARRIADGGHFPRFSPDGKWISYSDSNFIVPRQQSAKIHIVSASSGSPRPLEIDLPSAMGPVWSPDSKYLLFLGGTEAASGGGMASDWWVVPVEGGKAIKLGATELLEDFGLDAQNLLFRRLPISPQDWLADGNRLVFSAGLRRGPANLWQVRISPGDWRLVGQPERLTAGTGETDPSTAVDGRIAFSSPAQDWDIWSLPIDADRAKVLGRPERFISGLSLERYPTVSADGRSLVYVSDRSGNYDVWLRDLETGEDRPVTITPEPEPRAAISSDGSKVAYVRREAGRGYLYFTDLATGSEKKLVEEPAGFLDWMPGGQEILYASRIPPQPLRRWMLTAERGEKAELLLQHPGYQFGVVRFSPDRRWLSFKAGLPASQEHPTFVSPVRNGQPAGKSEWIEVSSVFNSRNWWSPDGNVLYFLSHQDTFMCIVAQHLDPATKKPVGAPVDILHLHGRRRISHGTSFGYGMTADRLYFPIAEQKANIWLAEPQGQP